MVTQHPPHHGVENYDIPLIARRLGNLTKDIPDLMMHLDGVRLCRRGASAEESCDIALLKADIEIRVGDVDLLTAPLLNFLRQLTNGFLQRETEGQPSSVGIALELGPNLGRNAGD